MKKSTFLVVLFILSCDFIYSQKSTIDSLLQIARQEKQDTDVVQALLGLSQENNNFKILFYANKALTLSSKLHYTKGIVGFYNQIGYYFQAI